jgi:large subunit ribosomal protein L18
MRSIHKITTRAHERYRRHLRVRKKVRGTAARPRLVVFRSSKHTYAQLVDDDRGVTLLGASDRSDGIQADAKGKSGKSFALGQLVADKAKTKGITKVVFDRAGYRYHGRVKAVAEGARKGGLEF